MQVSVQMIIINLPNSFGELIIQQNTTTQVQSQVVSRGTVPFVLKHLGILILYTCVKRKKYRRTHFSIIFFQTNKTSLKPGSFSPLLTSYSSASFRVEALARSSEKSPLYQFHFMYVDVFKSCRYTHFKRQIVPCTPTQYLHPS